MSSPGAGLEGSARLPSRSHGFAGVIPFLRGISMSRSRVPPPSPVIITFQPPKWDKGLDADSIFICCP